MRISVNDRLLLKFQLTWKLMLSLYSHRTIVITVQLSQNEVVNGCRNLAKKSSLLDMNLENNEHNPWVSGVHTLLHWRTSPSSNSKVRTPTGSSWIERPQNLLFKLLSPQNFHPLPSQWQAIIMGWWLTWHPKYKNLYYLIHSRKRTIMGILNRLNIQRLHPKDKGRWIKFS